MTHRIHPPPPTTVMDAVKSELPLKLTLLMVLPIAFLVPYFLLQRFVIFPVRTVPVTALDRWVSFNPDWVLVYESLWLWLPVAPLLSTRREHLWRYTRGVLFLSGGCFVIFFLWPVAAPRPVSWPEHSAYDLLVRYDGLVNSIPSLHAGLVVYSGLIGCSLLRPLTAKGRYRLCVVVAWIWGALIVYSTLPTKQHWAIDLPPGAMAGWWIHRWIWRTPAAGPTHDAVQSSNANREQGDSGTCSIPTR